MELLGRVVIKQLEGKTSKIDNFTLERGWWIVKKDHQKRFGEKRSFWGCQMLEMIKIYFDKYNNYILPKTDPFKI